MQPLVIAQPSKRRFYKGYSTPLPLNLGTADLMRLVSLGPMDRLLPPKISSSSPIVCSRLSAATLNLRLEAISSCSLVPASSTHLVRAGLHRWVPLAVHQCSPDPPRSPSAFPRRALPEKRAAPSNILWFRGPPPKINDRQVRTLRQRIQ